MEIKGFPLPTMNAIPRLRTGKRIYPHGREHPNSQLALAILIKKKLIGERFEHERRK